MEVSHITKIITQIVSERVPHVIAIYLFGSAATNEMSRESDIDIAILSTAPLTAEEAFEIKTDISAALKKDVDLVDMLRADSVTASQIILTGKILFQSDEQQCAIFETAALAKYLDLNLERREIIEDIEKRGSVYGR